MNARVAGVLLALLFPIAKHIRDEKLRRQYYLMQAITLIGAVVGAKLSVLVGDCHIVCGSAFVIGGAPGVGKSRASVALAEQERYTANGLG